MSRKSESARQGAPEDQLSRRPEVSTERDRVEAHWECPCGTEPPKPGARTIPVRTIVSLMVPWCPWCKRAFREEYRREGIERDDRDRQERDRLMRWELIEQEDRARP